MDDKHRCKVGEPNYPVAAVERGKKVVVAASGCKFVVSDHDFTKFALIPSVTVLCDVPDNIDSSFYRGHVFVGLKDAATEPSSPMRHSAELHKLFVERNVASPVVLIYTDGGPDHNTTYLSVKLGIIAFFLQHDLDMIEAVRTAPYHSWKNPRERVNCILNLGLQAVGLMRSTMAEKYEKEISSCSSVQDVRKQFEESPGLKEALQYSMEPVKVLVHSLFSRLKLKEKLMLSFASASDCEVEAFANILREIEPDLEELHATKKDLKKLPKLKKFLSHCCYERKYVFGVKKCGQDGCKICKAPRLRKEVFDELKHIPDPMPTDDQQHYQPFASVYGTFTTEKHRPSLKTDSKGGHGIPFSPSAQTARGIVMCCECLRPRVLYAQHKLNYAELRAVSRTLDELLYTCGSTLQGVTVDRQKDGPVETTALFERVFARATLTCEDPVEVPYSSCEMFPLVCVHCACEHDHMEEGRYPICELCKQEGKTAILKRKRKLFTRSV